MLHTNDTVNIGLDSPFSTKRRPEPRRRRSYVRAACNTCRTRKVACDGERPVCNNCGKKGLQCAYVTLNADETQTSALKRKVQELQEDLNDQTALINHFARESDDVVLSLLRQLRATGNASAVMHAIQSGMLYKKHRPSDYRPSEYATARAVLPQTPINFVLELTTLYPNTYPVFEPINTAALSINDLFAPKRGYTPVAASITKTSPAALASIEMEYPSPPPEEGWQIGPVQPPSYIDERLRSLRMDYWTCVPITDEFAATVLSLYLRTDHSYQGFFDADLVIRDLVELRSEFCSPFLVAALFFYACQLHAAVDLRSSAISHAFFVQAEMLWKTERASDSVTTAIALQLFSLGSLCHGKDQLSVQLLQEGRLMAERLSLLNVPPNSMIERQFYSLSIERQRYRAHAAWGIYIWLTYHTFFYEDQGVLFPPMYPIPGKHATELTAIGEVNSACFGAPHCRQSTLAAICELCVIAQEVANVYYDQPPDAIAERVPLPFVESKYRKLLSWAEGLPPELIRNNNYREDALVMHIYYHVVILAIFRPFLNHPQAQRLRTFSSNDSSPRTVYAASVEQLKFLVLVTRLKHPHAINPLLASTGHMHICSAVMANRSDPEWKFYFMLCVAYYRELYARHPVCEYTLQALLALAMVNDALTTSEARKIMDSLKNKGRHHRITEQLTGSYTMDFNHESTDRLHTKANVLAEKFEELTTRETSMADGFIPVDGPRFPICKTKMYDIVWAQIDKDTYYARDLTKTYSYFRLDTSTYKAKPLNQTGALLKIRVHPEDDGICNSCLDYWVPWHTFCWGLESKMLCALQLG